MDVRLYADLGAYYHLDGAFESLLTPKGVYRCPNVKLVGYNVFTNKPGRRPHALRRSSGRARFPGEVHMDRLAEKLGIDPLAFRIKNYARKEDGDQDRKWPFGKQRPR